MAGIYIHIPFCKQACHYCNFHFSTSLRYKKELLQAIEKELRLQKDYLEGETIGTIYFGGGTPSLLEKKEIEQLLNTIYKLFPVREKIEITLECNPDDLTIEKLKELKETPVNRLSIGIQSFHQADLALMNRAHNATEARNAIQDARSHGFENLTIDLIYGTPTLTDELWLENLRTIFDYKIPHISCYCLTVEPNTAMDHFVKKGKMQAVNEEQAARQFELLMQRMEINGYEHYEISNFALPGHYSKHNTAYWQSKKYLGIGPSAHSFNQKSRQWNIAHNQQYLQSIQKDILPFEKEILTPSQRYNEYIMTALRTKAGVNLDTIRQIKADLIPLFIKKIDNFMKNDTIIHQGNSYFLTKKGKLLADNIAMQLFIDI